MNATENCPQCGGRLKAGPGGVLCARCLLAAALRPPAAAEGDNPPGAGERIGAYRIVRLLGEGGMGVVYLAEQEQPIARQVALKIIKLGMDTRAVLARFQSEQQALALMDHPNIAQVYEAGSSAEGRPYFVMEYVPGVPITEYCDRRRLNTRQRLELFVQVANAVQHAHQKGVIHRDLKPSNVLVMERDGEAVPKIIDFGLAKATEKHLTEETVFTEAGVLIGTPEYMSPEQASLGGTEVDTRTDIYSLGVLLYELLVGAVPFEPRALRSAGYDEIRRIIRETDPPKPSARFDSLGARTAEIASCRATDAGALRKQLRGDLEWITLKALEKDCARRYPSASELALDVQHYLRDEPVNAGPVGAAYRIRKFVRKNRLAVGGAAAVVLALALGLAVSSWFLVQLKRQQVLTERESYVANLAGAESNLERGNVEEAARCLDRCPPRLRGWEWRYLNARFDTSVRTLFGRGAPFFGPPKAAAAFAFSPDGKRMLWNSSEALNVWPAGSDVRSAVYGGFGEILAASRDGNRIVARSFSERKTLRVYDPAARTAIAVLPSTGAEPASAAFDASGTRVMVGWSDGALSLWHVDSGRTTVRQRAHAAAVRVVAFSPDDARVISGSDDGWSRVWDAAGLRQMAALEGHSGAVASIAISPDGGRAAIASKDRAIRLWEWARRAPVVIRPTDREVLRTAFSADGRWLAYSGPDALVRVAEVASGRVLATLTGAIGGGIASLAFRDSQLYSAAEWGEIRVWDASGWSDEWKHASGEIESLAINSAGTRILAVLSSGMEIWDGQSGAVLAVRSPKGPGTPARFSGDGSRAAWGLLGGVNVWDGAKTQSYRGHKDWVRSVGFSPDGTLLASGSSDGTVRIWNKKGETTRTLDFGEPAWYVLFSPDGRRLLAAGDKKTFRIWSTESWQLIANVNTRFAPGFAKNWGPRFTPDGKHVYCLFGDPLDKIGIWDSRSGELTGAFPRESRLWTIMGFSPDGTRMLALSSEDELYFWDTAAHEVVAALKTGGPVAWAAFFPDGSRLLAGLQDGTIRVFDSRPGSRAEALRWFLSEQERLEFDQKAPLQTEQDLVRYAHSSKLEPRLLDALIGLVRAYGDSDDRIEPRWESVKSDRSGERVYRETLAWAERLAAVEPSDGKLLTILGAAQYRVGQFQAAIETLRRCQNTREWDPAFNAAFLAMAHYRAGHVSEAQGQLAELRRLAREPERASRPEVQDLLREAETTLAARGR